MKQVRRLVKAGSPLPTIPLQVEAEVAVEEVEKEE